MHFLTSMVEEWHICSQVGWGQLVDKYFQPLQRCSLGTKSGFWLVASKSSLCGPDWSVELDQRDCWVLHLLSRLLSSWFLQTKVKDLQFFSPHEVQERQMKKTKLRSSCISVGVLECVVQGDTDWNPLNFNGVCRLLQIAHIFHQCRCQGQLQTDLEKKKYSVASRWLHSIVLLKLCTAP